MHEIELKFQVPTVARSAVDAAVAGRTAAARTRLQAVYVDTPDHALAGAGLALRLRREGRRWVQTLKGRTPDLMQRHEHNVPRGTAPRLPPIDPTLHAGTPVGDALLALLAARPNEPLGMRYRTDILRRTRSVRARSGRVELAFDVGRILAGERSIDVLELEIESLSGSPLAVLGVARDWVTRHTLWLDMRSKAERGDLLERGETMAAPRRADPIVLMRDMSPAVAWRAVLGSCAAPILANASQVAAGEYLPEHVHQLRVGLRRLRSAVRLFERDGADAVLVDGAAILFRRLGRARDAAVFESDFADDLRAALRRKGLTGEIAWAPPATELPTAVVRESASQLFLLDVLAAMHDSAGGANAEPDLRDRMARRLNRWHRQVAADAARFTDLDDAALHRLRKRAKRLRYAAEFTGALFERSAWHRYLRAMDVLQDRLGAVTDVLMAERALGSLALPHPQRRAALQWLGSRRKTLVRKAARDARAFADVERFWKR